MNEHVYGLAGTASPEQVAQAVAEQISQQARQQNAEAGGEAPVPLLSALRTYMQRLNAMYEGDASARFLNLPPIATGMSPCMHIGSLRLLEGCYRR